VWVTHVLRHNVPWLPLYFSSSANDLYTPSTRESGWLHDIHAFEIILFTVSSELAEVVREDVSFWAEIEFAVSLSEALNVLPHQVFASNLV